MRLIPAFLLLCLTAFTPAHGQDGSASVEGTIQGQFDAFRADDFARAFEFASPTIRTIFGTAENFGAMVRQGYPMVHRPATVRMLEQRDVSGAVVQRVMVTDQSGATHMLDYQMIQTPEGWQINGVQLLPSSGIGA